MTEINRAPLGILGFLGIKNGGRNPRVLGDVLSPTWDLSMLYLNNEPTYAERVFTQSATGYTMIFEVPPGEVWYVTEYGGYVYANVGEAWRGSIHRSQPNIAITVPLGPLLDIGADARTQGWLTRPIWMTAGETIGIATATITGTVDVYGSIRYVRLQA